MITSFIVWIVAMEVNIEKLSEIVCDLRDGLLYKDKDAAPF